MKKKLTKLEQLFDEPDYGVSTANGSLSKILRGFWRDMGLTHLHINQLIDKWLEDPANEYEQDTTKINNARGNIRKDNEKDDSTWKVFLRNLRMMRPLEVRFLIRLMFKNGETYRQVAIMRPRSTGQFNSDFIFEKGADEDGFVNKDPNDYDDEGHHRDEKEFLPKNICVHEVTEKGFYYFSNEDLFRHVNNLNKDEYEVETIPTKDLFDSALGEIQNSWKKDFPQHLRRIEKTDLSYPIISHDNFITDGFHRIVKAYLTGVKELKVKRIKTLPEVKYYPHPLSTILNG